MLLDEVKPKQLTSINAVSTLLTRASRYSVNLDEHLDKDEIMATITTAHTLIYRGMLRPSGTEVAIKMVRGSFPGDADAIKVNNIRSTMPSSTDHIQRALREVYVWSKLHHENVVPLLGIATKFNQTVSLITEWMSRGNAHDYVQDKSIDPHPLVGRSGFEEARA